MAGEARKNPPDVARLPLGGLTASWRTVNPGANDSHSTETLTLAFENEAWTAEGIVTGADIQYVLRLSVAWQLQQILLFRDLEDPDLWLANDGHGKWGEVNGAQRRDLGGCSDIDLRCSSFTRTMAIRRLRLAVGASCDVHSVVVDTQTLATTRSRLNYTRLNTHLWAIHRDDDHFSHEFTVDEYGLPHDIPGHFTRIS